MDYLGFDGVTFTIMMIMYAIGAVITIIAIIRRKHKKTDSSDQKSNELKDWEKDDGFEIT